MWGNTTVNFFFTVQHHLATATLAVTHSPRGYLINKWNVRPNYLAIDFWVLTPLAFLWSLHKKLHTLGAMDKRLQFVRQTETVDRCSRCNSQFIGCINNNKYNNC